MDTSLTPTQRIASRDHEPAHTHQEHDPNRTLISPQDKERPPQLTCRRVGVTLDADTFTAQERTVEFANCGRAIQKKTDANQL
jgi:hypothetical protein